MTDLARAMKIAELEGDLKMALAQIGALRQALSSAICAVCGDGLHGEDFALNEDDNLSHKRCVE